MRWLCGLLVGLLCAASCTGSGIRSPVFTWGSSEYIQPGPSSRRVSYQVLNRQFSSQPLCLLCSDGTLACRVESAVRVERPSPVNVGIVSYEVVSVQVETTNLLESLLRGVLPGGNIEAGAERWFRLDGAKPEVLVIFHGREVRDRLGPGHRIVCPSAKGSVCSPVSD